MKQTIIEKIRKIMEIADRGTDGEKSAAMALVNSLLTKYGLTIDDVASESKRWHVFTVGRNIYHKRLIKQLYGVMLDLHEVETKERGTSVAFFCTDMEAAELQRQYDFFTKELARAWKEQRDAIYDAFIYRNNLYPSSPDPNPKTSFTKEELEHLKAVMRISEGIRTSSYYKQLEK